MPTPKGFRQTTEARAKIAAASRRRWQGEAYRERVTAGARKLRKMPSGSTLGERLDFYSMPEPNSGCMLWLGPVNQDGYGRIRWQKRTWPAHRAAWLTRHGEIPAGLIVCHRCDNPPCVNPDHLWLGSYSDNNADRDVKGRCRRKLSTEQILAIRADDRPRSIVAREHDTSFNTIWLIQTGRAWRHVGRPE